MVSRNKTAALTRSASRPLLSGSGFCALRTPRAVSVVRAISTRKVPSSLMVRTAKSLFPFVLIFGSALFIEGDDSGAAKANIVLEGDLGALDLTLIGHAAELPVELGALGKARGS